MAMRIEAGGEPDLPDIDPSLEYLVSYLFEAGPTSAIGMGPVPLTWADLEAWQRGTGVLLQLWQARVIRKLSGDYLTESQSATAFDAPPPWIPETTTEQRARLARHIRNVFRG